MDEHVEKTIATYNAIAPYYKLTATPEVRAWEESSMRLFANYLNGSSVLVPGCGDGRDSRYLFSLGLDVFSFDLSDGMLSEARNLDPDERYYAYYRRDEIANYLQPFERLYERDMEYAEEIVELWLRKGVTPLHLQPRGL